MKYRITIDMWYPTPSQLGEPKDVTKRFLKWVFDEFISRYFAVCKWWTEVEVLDESERTS